MFRKLKKRFIKELILVVSDLDEKTKTKVNISNYVIKEVLFIKYKNRKWRFVAYFSKSLNKIEKNYKIYNKKILVVIRRLEN